MDKLTAILMPGIDGTGKMFGPLMACLPDWIAPQVIHYPCEDVLSYDELTEHVLAQLPEGDFIILAESFGGPLALMLYTRLPTRVKAIILTCTFLTNPRPWLSKPAKWLMRDWMLAMKPRKWMAKMFVTGFDISDEMLARAFAIHEQVATKVTRHRLYDVFDVDVRDLLKHCEVPLLHLYGEHDHLILKYSAREIQAVRPDIPSKCIAGPHYLYQMRPAQCSEQIDKFLLANHLGRTV